MEHRPDEALAAALAGPVPGEDGGERSMSLDELADATGLPLTLLEAIQREGLLVPHLRDGQPSYSRADAEVLRAALSLMETGVPLDEFLNLARRHDEAMRAVAREAVELFVRFVRDPIQGTAASEQEASDRLVTAFRDMLPATSEMVGHHFRRLLLAEAHARIERDGRPDELAALREADRST